MQRWKGQFVVLGCFGKKKKNTNGESAKLGRNALLEAGEQYQKEVNWLWWVGIFSHAWDFPT